MVGHVEAAHLEHQQVQLLEATSVLLAMNNDAKDSATTPLDSAKDFASDPESASPSPRGSRTGRTAARRIRPLLPSPKLRPTTPRDRLRPYRVHVQEAQQRQRLPGARTSRRRSPPVRSRAARPSAPGFAHFGHPSHGQNQRPTSSRRNATKARTTPRAGGGGRAARLRPGQQPGLAAGGAPARRRAAGAATPRHSTWTRRCCRGRGFVNSFPSRAPESFTRGTVRELHRGGDDVKMDGSGDSVADERRTTRSCRGPGSDEDDDGVFGRWRSRQARPRSKEPVAGGDASQGLLIALPLPSSFWIRLPDTQHKTATTGGKW